MDRKSAFDMLSEEGQSFFIRVSSGNKITDCIYIEEISNIYLHNFYPTGIHHAESGNTDYQLQLEIWKGNIGKALELAVEKKQLSDWLVAISHLGKSRVHLGK